MSTISYYMDHAANAKESFCCGLEPRRPMQYHISNFYYQIATSRILITIIWCRPDYQCQNQRSCHNSWWRHLMETYFALLALCAGNSPVAGEFLAKRSVTRSFDVFFELHLNKRLSEQSWGWWFETPSRSLWCHCNGDDICVSAISWPLATDLMS